MFEINLKAVTVSKNLKEYNEIKSLICRAFPKNEQFPMWLLRMLAIRKSVDFLNIEPLETTADKLQIVEYKSAIRKLSFGLYLSKIISKVAL